MIPQLRHISAILLVFGISLDAAAMAIGQVRGDALIGKPLNITVPLTLDAGEIGGDLCLQAEVTQGETRLPDRRVTVSLDAGARPGASRLRIRSTVPINEPVVTINLKAGCQVVSSRQFVMLAELSAEPALPAVATRAGQSTGSGESARADASTVPNRAGPAGLQAAPTEPTMRPDRRASRSGSAPEATAAAEPMIAAAEPVARSRSSGSSDSGLAGLAPSARRAVEAWRVAEARRGASVASEPPPSASPSAAPEPAKPIGRSRNRPSPSAVPVVRPPAPAKSSVAAGPLKQKRAAAPLTPAAPPPTPAPDGPSATAQPRLQVEPVDAGSFGGTGPAGKQSGPEVAAALQKEAPTAIAGGVEKEAPMAGAGGAESGEGTRSALSESGATDAARSADAQRLQALEDSLAQLRTQMSESQNTLMQLRSDLAYARQNLTSNPLIYALLGLLLLALIGLALMWRSTRRARELALWHESRLATASVLPSAGLDDEGAEDRFDMRDSIPLQTPAPSDTGAGTASASAKAAATAIPPVATALALQQPAEAESRLRTTSAEELLDVQQQADFFTSLGQNDQAISVLTEHIRANPTTSAMAYLDLFSIYHSLGRRGDYLRLRDAFGRRFNAEVPEFDRYSEIGQGLEQYPKTLGEITARWPSPATLTLIEDLIFRNPDNQNGEIFQLSAYQELLLLYGVAKEVVDPNARQTSAPRLPTAASAPVDEEQTTERAPIRAEFSSADEEIDRETSVDEDAGLTLPPTIYEPIDSGDQSTDPQSLMASSHSEPGGSMDALLPVHADFAEFDRTTYETLPADLENEPPAPAKPAPLDLELDLFDPLIEAEIAPRPSRH